MHYVIPFCFVLFRFVSFSFILGSLRSSSFTDWYLCSFVTIYLAKWRKNTPKTNVNSLTIKRNRIKRRSKKMQEKINNWMLNFKRNVNVWSALAIFGASHSIHAHSQFKCQHSNSTRNVSAVTNASRNVMRTEKRMTFQMKRKTNEQKRKRKKKQRIK